MLMESEMWLITQASAALRKRTDTGSMPTGMEPMASGVPVVTSKTSSLPSGRLQTASRELSGLNAMG